MMQGESPAGMIKLGLKWISIIMLISGELIMAVLLWLARPLEETTEVINELSPAYLIAHAGGAVNGQTYTNSKTALVNALNKGFRYIELDLFKTPDGNVVCTHDSSTYKIKPIMSLREAVGIWLERPFEFVVDKISEPQILNHYFKKNREHVYVEAFCIDDYKQLKEDGYVPMLSLGGDLRGFIKYLVTSLYCGKVKRIVLYYKTPEYLLRIYKRLGAKIAVYTINDESNLKKHICRDVDMVYTDFLIPSDLSMKHD